MFANENIQQIKDCLEFFDVFKITTVEEMKLPTIRISAKKIGLVIHQAKKLLKIY